ncbi:MAG: Phenylacetate-coenzyme A ligase [Lentisphaerae bacterium ADurb.BinA184]|nr:MAG: Phenylacetate-coenzyme A ligase [Lentisphaerae bacterium ADurb.BinA184]
MSDFVVENRIWNRAEVLPRKALRALQLRRLRRQLEQAARVPFYRERMAKAKLTPQSLKSLDDLRRLPFTVKDDLRRNYPLGLCAVPRAELARIHGSSGTTGSSTFVGYTRKDLATWAELCARFLTSGGLRPEHTVQIAFGYGLFTGGFGLHYGVERVGAALIPAAAGNTARQIRLLRDLEVDVLVCTPSYALVIAEGLAEAGTGPHALHLRYGHLGAEPWTEDMRVKIEQQLGILAFNNYGLSEVIGPGVSGECPLRNGMHIQEDHFIVECVNPETLEPVAEGEVGELVFTSLTKEACPVLRYRTRDLASLNSEPCPCGRTGVRMSRVTGRTDDMLIIRGVNVFPLQVEEALLGVAGTAPHYMIIVDRPGNLDEATVQVEIQPGSFSDEMRAMQALRERIDRALQANTGIRFHVELVRPQSLERHLGKAVHVRDLRRDKGLL